MPNEDQHPTQIDADLNRIISLFNGSEPLYCLCSGPYTTSMISCDTCCNCYHRSCLDRYGCGGGRTGQPYICPLCDESLTMRQVAVLDEKLYQEAQARSKAAKKSRSGGGSRPLDIDSDDIVIYDEIMVIKPTKAPRPDKKSKSKSVTTWE